MIPAEKHRESLRHRRTSSGERGSSGPVGGDIDSRDTVRRRTSSQFSDDSYPSPNNSPKSGEINTSAVDDDAELSEEQHGCSVFVDLIHQWITCFFVELPELVIAKVPYGRDLLSLGFLYIFAQVLRTQLTIAPNFFSKLTKKLKTKFGISCSKEWVNTILKSIYHPVLCISYLVSALVFWRI